MSDFFKACSQNDICPMANLPSLIITVVNDMEPKFFVLANWSAHFGAGIHITIAFVISHSWQPQEIFYTLRWFENGTYQNYGHSAFHIFVFIMNELMSYDLWQKNDIAKVMVAHIDYTDDHITILRL